MRHFAIFALSALCGCAHLASSNATFVGKPEAGRGPLVLRVTRHMDTIVRGPDIEEDQLLELQLRDFQLNQKLTIPSANVKPRFTVERSGPSSEGKEFRGFIIVKSVSAEKIVVRLELDIEARTASGSYIQQAKFQGDYTFYPRPNYD